jgi:hypothetical protein
MRTNTKEQLVKLTFGGYDSSSIRHSVDACKSSLTDRSQLSLSGIRPKILLTPFVPVAKPPVD